MVNILNSLDEHTWGISVTLQDFKDTELQEKDSDGQKVSSYTSTLKTNEKTMKKTLNKTGQK